MRIFSTVFATLTLALCATTARANDCTPPASKHTALFDEIQRGACGKRIDYNGTGSDLLVELLLQPSAAPPVVHTVLYNPDVHDTLITMLDDALSGATRLPQSFVSKTHNITVARTLAACTRWVSHRKCAFWGLFCRHTRVREPTDDECRMMVIIG
jgi:hypothetical protein